jgi:hypothetical protein
MVVGLLISFTPLSLVRDKCRYVLQGFGLLLPELAMIGISIWTFGRLFASTFHPFIYFRF